MDPHLPLAEDWRDLLQAVAEEHRLAHDPQALARAVSELSRAYNGLDPTATTRGRGALAARLAFSFTRDVPKAASAVRELIGAGLLRLPSDRELRVIDVGAGLGAMTWGVASALANAGQSGKMHAAWTDVDADALAIGATVARRAGRVGEVEVRVTLDKPRGEADLVILGQVLSEMDLAQDEESRASRHEALLREWLLRVASDGSLVVVEPALRDRTRHLHRVRDRLAASGVAPFAPCLHSEPCPALAHATDWCHEDRPIDLPKWLVPLARAAGLRWEGLTYSYLVLRRDGKTVRSSLHGPSGLVRVTSRALVTKGKSERVVCGAVSRSGELVGGSARVAVLDREKSGRDAWDATARGELLAFEPPVDEGTSRIRLERTRVSAVDATDPGGYPK